MATGVVRSCQCGLCGSGIEHREVEYHRQMNLLLSRLDEQQRRWYLAVESQRLGHGADRLLFEITGVDEKTIRRGREELAASLAEQPTDRIRQPGGGRPAVEKKLGRQTFRVEEAFSSGQIGGWVTPELALESACCLALSELLAQSTPLRQILGLQLGGAKGMVLAGGGDQSDAATRQEHRCGYLTAARAPLVIPR